MPEYSIPVTHTEEGLVLDTFAMEDRDNTRTDFSPEEKAIIKKMNKDAEKLFETLEDISFTSTPDYRSIREHIKCGCFRCVWYAYIQLLGISEEEAIKRYCMRQPEIDEQGNKEQVEPDEPEL